MDLIGEAGAAISEAADHRVLAGETVEYERALELRGRQTVMHVVKAPLRDDASGAVIGVCGIARDITGRKHSEERLRRQLDMQNLVSRIARRFIDITPSSLDAELKRIVRDIGEFAGVDRSYVDLHAR